MCPGKLGCRKHVSDGNYTVTWAFKRRKEVFKAVQQIPCKGKKKKTILKALLLHASDFQSSPGTWRGRRIIFWCLSDKAGTMQQGWDSHSPEVTVPPLCGC